MKTKHYVIIAFLCIAFVTLEAYILPERPRFFVAVNNTDHHAAPTQPIKPVEEREKTDEEEQVEKGPPMGIAARFTIPPRKPRKLPDPAKVKRMVDPGVVGEVKEGLSLMGHRIPEEKKLWREFVEKKIMPLSAMPEPYRGKERRGIVFSCAHRYEMPCVANIKIILDVHRSRIPIEVWSEGSSGFDSRLEKIAARHPGLLRKRSFSEIQQNYTSLFGPLEKRQDRPNFQYKVMAIMGSNFKQVLMLDSDNTIARDPASVFKWPEFKKTGAVMWPDIVALGDFWPMWDIMGVKPFPTNAHESGMLLIDKEKVWKGMMLAAYMNQKQEFYYRQLHGDKDTYFFAFEALHEPYHMIQFPLTPYFYGNRHCGKGFAQADPEGSLLFVHSVLDKVETDWAWLKLYDPELTSISDDIGCIDTVRSDPAGASQWVRFSDMFGNLRDMFSEMLGRQSD